MGWCDGIAVFDWVAFGAILAAVVALYAAWQNYRTMENARKANFDVEVMRLREKWIWDLRQQMAEFVALSLSLRQLQDEDPDYIEQRLRFDQLYSLIPFMMDPETDMSSVQLQVRKQLLKTPESQNYYVRFDKIRSQMGLVETAVVSKSTIRKELSELEKLFHSYLRYHWINLQNENVRPNAKNK